MRRKYKNHNYKMAKIMEHHLSDEDLYVLETFYAGDIDKFLTDQGELQE